MKVYEIYEHPEHGRKAVKVGFSWPGFFFHIYWAVIKRLWLPAGAYFLFILFFLITRKSHVVPSILPLPMGTVFLPLLLKSCFAVHGNQWISQYLINHGYQLVSKLNAKSGSDALWRFENTTDIAEPIFSPVREYGSYVSLCVVICFWLLLKISFPAFYMAGPGMLNTLKINDRVITNRFAYTSSEPKIGDLVAFRVPKTIPNYDPRKPIWIKRIVGLEGDRVTIEDNHLMVNGQRVTDPPFLATNTYVSELGRSSTRRDIVSH